MSTPPHRFGDDGTPDTQSSAAARRRLEAGERSVRRLELPVATGIAVMGVVVVAGGGTSPGLLVLGAWLIALAALLLWGRSVRDRSERGAGPRGPAPRLTTVDGEPATVITAPFSRLAVTLCMQLLVALPLLAGGFALLLGGTPGIGALVAVAGAVSLVPVALIVAGRTSPGGLWLTPTAVVVRDHGLESRIAWPTLVTVADGSASGAGNGKVLLRADAGAGAIHRSRTAPWPAAAPMAGPTTAVLDTRWLNLDGRAVAEVVRYYQRTQQVADLGTPESLRTIERLSRPS